MEKITITINQFDLATIQRGAEIGAVSLEYFIVLSAVREAQKLQNAELLLDSVFPECRDKGGK